MRDAFNPNVTAFGPAYGCKVVPSADTFNRHFESDKLHAALKLLTAAGYRVQLPRVDLGDLCAGGAERH